MAFGNWLVAFNHPSRTWSSGGSFADYERPHWDYYLVRAGDRGAAENRARALRLAQRRVTTRQLALLLSLRAESSFEEVAADKDAEEVKRPWIHVLEHEVLAARGLHAKGLVEAASDDCRDVRPTISAWNRAFHEAAQAPAEA